MVKENVEDILDKNKQLTLHSKLSIAFVSIVFSPIFGSYLFSENVRKVTQKKNYYSIVIGLLFLNFIVTIPFYGLPISHQFNPLLHINKIVIPLLILLPLWKKNIKPKNHIPIFSVKYLLIFGCLYFVAFLNNYCINSPDCSKVYDHYAFIYFSCYAQFYFLPHILIAKFTIQILASRVIPLFKSKILK
jgi:hypothetical protein